ncbi:hypothetical protein BS46_gp96 [Acinetobacter phage BS46]|nr:hypothetical protein BS46_gp96 [Acinetobacter phage BS46]
MSARDYYDNLNSNLKVQTECNRNSSDVKFDIDKFIVFGTNDYGETEQVSIGLNTYEEAKSFIDRHTNRIGSSLFIMVTIKE